MLDPINGLPATVATASRARSTDWSFLARLAQATQAYVARRGPALTGAQLSAQSLDLATAKVSAGAASLRALAAPPAIARHMSVAKAAKTPLRRAVVSNGDPGGALVAPPPPSASASTPGPSSATLADGLAAPASTGAFTLDQYPRPGGDSGRGFDWIPTLGSTSDVVDHFVKEARSMGASWVTFLNDGSNVGQNDYLVRQLVTNHIEPIMRIYTDHGSPIDGNLTAMVQHYVGLGVHYFLPYNEPNLPSENPNGVVSVDSYVDEWVTAARAIVAGGGLPGIGGLAPAAPVDDVMFLQQSLERLRRRGELGLLDQGWISVHNYTFNRPADYAADSNGFLKFRWYDHVAQTVLGRSIPVISTEGGPRMGADLDPRFPAVDETRRDQLAMATFDYLPTREPYFFAQTEWLLANEAGGGHDPAWNADSLFKADGSPTPLALDFQESGSVT